ncbi:hypothetical protein C8J57DRAFT_1222731 [Mycena rebaudengoi]|nr:hypothetical protein C8J57DRAFT_1222731 [Mycena rebaudengoi]
MSPLILEDGPIVARRPGFNSPRPVIAGMFPRITKYRIPPKKCGTLNLISTLLDLVRLRQQSKWWLKGFVEWGGVRNWFIMQMPAPVVAYVLAVIWTVATSIVFTEPSATKAPLALTPPSPPLLQGLLPPLRPLLLPLAPGRPRRSSSPSRFSFSATDDLHLFSQSPGASVAADALFHSPDRTPRSGSFIRQRQ